MTTPSRYQRVGNVATNPADYDTAGFPYYLRFDGTDDAMSTASIDFTATDKMAVFAGVRKASSTQNIIVELSSGWASNNGSFSLQSNVDNSTPAKGTYTFQARGDAAWSTGHAVAALQYDAPVTNVLAGTANISGDLNTLRVNGTAATAATTDQGSGNFGTYPLYIGARNASSVYFTGRVYALIVRAAATSDADIAATEDWVEAKTFGKDMSYVYTDELQTAAGEAITTASGDSIFMSVSYQ